VSKELELAAQAAGALFYTLPSELEVDKAIDPHLRLAVSLINSSGWVWTAECCQGHPDETDLFAPWGFNVEPYLRLVCRAQDLGDAVASILSEAWDEDSKLRGTPQMKIHTRPLKAGWMEFSVYAVARNVAERNRGCLAFERFGMAISGSRDSRTTQGKLSQQGETK
jgi:hypothetical protein